LVSYLSVITNICGVLILTFTVFLERFKSKKKLTIALTILTKAATFFIVTIPAFVPPAYQLVLFVFVVIIAFTLQAQTTVSLNNWMVDFIPAEKSGRYISFRQTLSLIVTVLLSLTSGYFMDSMQDEYTGFLLLFSFALFMGVIEVVLLLRTPDSPFPSSSPEKSGAKLWQAMKKPLKDRAFIKFVLYIVLFYMILNISDSFTNVYMRRYLDLPYTAITMMTLILSLPQIVFLGLWGRVSDKLGHQFVLKTSIWLFAGETLFLFLSSPTNCYWLIPIAFFIASIGNAGFIIAVFNRRYELIPPKNRIAYDNLYTAALGVGFILGPLLGGFIKSAFESIPFISSLMPIANIRLLYLLSAVGILVLQIIYTISDKKPAVCRSTGADCCCIGAESPCAPPLSKQ
ncbi:MAG: MFS transporter, partial [Oscillospiraceae bacterium]|nr:MFS transporter [Oscillospiraceae bacterium]